MDVTQQGPMTSELPEGVIQCHGQNLTESSEGKQSKHLPFDLDIFEVKILLKILKMYFSRAEQKPAVQRNRDFPSSPR